MKLTYKKGGTMGGCYKCGGKMHAAKGMKMGACYKCGGKMYAKNGMVMDEDPPVEPKITAPKDAFDFQTARTDNTTNKIQVLPTKQELVNAKQELVNANRPVITATKPKTAPKPEQKKQESVMQKILAEEQSGMVGALYGTPAPGTANSLGVIGENYLAENPDVAAGLLASIYAGPTAGLYAKGLLSAGKAIAKQALKSGVKGLNAYATTNLATNAPGIAAGLLSMGATKGNQGPNNVEFYNPNQGIKTQSDRASIMTNLGYLSGALRLLPNPIVRNLSNIASGAVLGSGVYDLSQGELWSGTNQILSPFLGGVAGKTAIGLTSKLPIGKADGFWNKRIVTPTQKMLGFSGGKPVKYNKSTGSYTDITSFTGSRTQLTDPFRGALSGANLKNILPSSYLFSPSSWKNISNSKNLSIALSENKAINNLNKQLKSAEFYKDKAKLIKDFKTKYPKLSGELNRFPEKAYTYKPNLSYADKVRYNFITSPFKSTAKTLGYGLLGAGAYDYMLNDSKATNKIREKIKGKLKFTGQ